MSNKNDSAFPQASTEAAYDSDGRGDLYANTYSVGGLTKREMMATMLMAGILANPKYDPPRRRQFPGMSQDAVSAVDALFAELERTK